MPFNNLTTFSAETLSENDVKFTMSAIITLISGFSKATGSEEFFRISAICFGIILWSNLSEVSRSWTRNFEYMPIGIPRTSRVPKILLKPKRLPVR